MRYCVYCGTPHEDNEDCGCEEARAERRRKASSEAASSEAAESAESAGAGANGTGNKKNNAASDPFSQLMGLYSMFADVADGESGDEREEEPAASAGADPFSALFGSAFASAFGGSGNGGSGRASSAEADDNSADAGKETIDVFKHIDLYYIGKSGCADANVRYLTRGGVISCCKFGVEPSSELANGDKVTVTLLNADELEERFDVKFAKREYVFTVRYLEEARRLDAFEEIDVVFSGTSGEGAVALMAKDEDSYAYCCDFYVEPCENLSNGDRVKVSIINRDQLIHAFGIVPRELEREYVVNTLFEYVKSPDDIDKNAVREYAERYLETERGMRGERPRYCGAYLFVKRDPKAKLRFGDSRVEIIVAFGNVFGAERGSYYPILGFTNLTHIPGQKAELDLSTAENDRIEGDLERYLRDEGEYYHIYKLD